MDRLYCGGGVNVRRQDKDLAQRLRAALLLFSESKRSLPGIEAEAQLDCFVRQLIESDRRVRFVAVLQQRAISQKRAEPRSSLFDPIRAAVLHRRAGKHDEACWLVFLSVYFGKSRTKGWALVRDVYSGLATGRPWTWRRINRSGSDFAPWLRGAYGELTRRKHRFGNHRKYESLDPEKARGPSEAFKSYVEWVKRAGPSHAKLFQEAERVSGGDPGATFDHLFRSMQRVRSFGRTARFDYLTMLGKLGLAPIEPASTYMSGATGPLAGAELLFGKSTQASRRKRYDAWICELARDLELGMQQLEDALCNWQKSPREFKGFRG